MQDGKTPQRFREIANIFQPALLRLPPPYAAVHSGNELFFAVWDEEGRTLVHAIVRLTPKSPHRVLKTLGGPGKRMVSVGLSCFDDLFVMLEEEEDQEDEGHHTCRVVE